MTRRRAPRVAIALAIISAPLLLFALAAPWAAAFPHRPDHYKITLFGVRHVMDMTAAAVQSACRWGAAGDCASARHAGAYYLGLLATPCLAIASLGLLTFGVARYVRQRPEKSAIAWVGAATMLIGAILMMRMVVVRALLIFTDAKPVLPGSGMIAAGIAAACLMIASASSAYQARGSDMVSAPVV